MIEQELLDWHPFDFSHEPFHGIPLLFEAANDDRRDCLTMNSNRMTLNRQLTIDPEDAVCMVYFFSVPGAGVMGGV
jgi:hypothetical protein